MGDSVGKVALNKVNQAIGITNVTALSNIYTINFDNNPLINIAITTDDGIAKTIAVSNVPTRTELYLELTYTNAASITWFSGITWQSGVTPTFIVEKVYRIGLFTTNGGTSWDGYVANTINGLMTLVKNQSIATQVLTAATRTYISGSNISFIPIKVVVGTRFRWLVSATKTAAGTATSTIDIAVGTLGTTGDTARLSFTKPVGTAVADCAYFVIDVVVRVAGSSCILQGHMSMTHNLSATGFAVIPCVNVAVMSSAFDISSLTNIGLCFTTGASDAYTINMVSADASL